MTDTTNDIDALIRDLRQNADCGYKTWRHAALTALVAERDGLKRRVKEQEADLRLMMMPFERSTASMIAEAQLRMTCSALTGIYANPNISGTPEANGENAAAAANAALDALSQPRAWSTCDPVRDLCGDRDSDLDGEALAAMRKGEADGK
jgi:hypothetical protein